MDTLELPNHIRQQVIVRYRSGLNRQNYEGLQYQQTNELKSNKELTNLLRRRTKKGCPTTSLPGLPDELSVDRPDEA